MGITPTSGRDIYLVGVKIFKQTSGPRPRWKVGVSCNNQSYCRCKKLINELVPKFQYEFNINQISWKYFSMIKCNKLSTSRTTPHPTTMYHLSQFCPQNINLSAKTSKWYNLRKVINRDSSLLWCLQVSSSPLCRLLNFALTLVIESNKNFINVAVYSN